MAGELNVVVRVLYDYTYTDDADEISIKSGDLYRLVEKTNDEWWQVYDPADAEGESFFVPAQYVEIISEDSALKALSDLDKMLAFDDRDDSPAPDYLDDNEDPYSTASPLHYQTPIIDGVGNYVNVGGSGEDDPGGGEGEYINLDLYRRQAGIASLDNSRLSESSDSSASSSWASKPAIPQELIQGTIAPPRPEEGTYVKVLLEGLPWDIYKEHTLGRLYYVNRETGERMWKPPRKPTPYQTLPKTPEEPESSPKLPCTPEKDENWSGIPPEYEQITDNGNLYFIHRNTQEKWMSINDQVGRQYYHRMGSHETLWSLPNSQDSVSLDYGEDSDGPRSLDSVYPRTPAEHTVQPQDVNWEAQSHRMSTFGGSVGGPPQITRASKASSTYGQIDTSAVANKISNRSSTLPANFAVARPAPAAPDRGWGPSTLPANSGQRMPPSPSSGLPVSQNQEEVYEGYINKAKIIETGKKKLKKNWAQSYLVLRGSNLIFYKDQKTSAHDGRNEGVVSLQGAHIVLNPTKDITSKKNTILLQSSSSNMFLFQTDSEKTILEWFTKMKLVANDVTPPSDRSSPVGLDVKGEKKAPTRSVSSDDGVNVLSVDKNKNLIGIRARLLSLISRRPTQEDLYKRGIIKDAVFGSRLHELCDKEKTHVPKFVHNCIAAVESRGLTHDGLYRVSGNMAEIQRLRCAVDKDERYDLYDAQWDVHVLTGSLKLFFRELKEPLYPFNMYNTFSEAISKENAKEKHSAFKKAVADLPRCNYFTIKELFQHLCKIIEMAHENRMHVQNIAIVFGPTLLWQQQDAGSLAVNTMVQSRIVEYMLLEFASLFVKK